MKPIKDITPSDITPRAVFENRREFIKLAGVSLVASTTMLFNTPTNAAITKNTKQTTRKLKTIISPYGKGEKLTSYEDVTSYNNFYEFGSDKSEPAINAKLFKTQPWTLTVEGEIKKNKTITIPKKE